MKLKSSTYQTIGLILLAVGVLAMGIYMGYGWRNDNSAAILGLIPFCFFILSSFFYSKAKKTAANENEQTETISPLKKRVLLLFVVAQTFSLGFYIGYRTVHENYTLPAYVSTFFYITPLFIAIWSKKKKEKK